MSGIKKILAVAVMVVASVSVFGDTVLATLSETKREHTITIKCSQPTLVTFGLQGNVTPTNSGNTYWSGSASCTTTIDGLKLSSDGYYFSRSSSWSGYEVDNSFKRYLTAGTHKIFIRVEYIYANNASTTVDIVNYTKSSIMPAASFYNWCETLAEDRVWLPNNIATFRSGYSGAISQDTADYESRVLRAVTTLLGIVEDERARTLLSQFGVSLSDFYLQPMIERVPLEDMPLSQDAVDEALSIVLERINNAIADVDAIPADWDGEIALTPDKYPALADTVYVDRAEVAVIRAALYLGRGVAKLVQGYDFTSDYLAVSNAYMDAATVAAILESAPEVGRIRDASKLVESKADFRAALNGVKLADRYILARTDSSKKYFLEYDAADESDITEARKIADAVIASLDNEAEIDGTYFFEKYELVAPPNGIVRKLCLASLFAGNVTRDLLPCFRDEPLHDGGGKNLGDLLLLDTIPDMTFGGVLPDFTLAELLKAWGYNKTFTVAGYKALDPEIILDEDRTLLVVGTATRNSDLAFTTNVAGHTELMVDGSYVPFAGEPVPMTAGQEYSIEYTPYYRSAIETPTKILSIVDAPEPLPDGEGYAETVDGVEWTFDIVDGKAVVTGVDAIKSRMIIPAYLGGRPVAVIAEASFLHASELNAIELPETLTTIEEEAFYRCGNLTSVVFRGNCPQSVGDDAFGKINTSCKFYATRVKTSWADVIESGTWQGYPIEYTAGYDPNLKVAANNKGGNFSISTELSLASPEGTTIYYTIDGSVPTAASVHYEGTMAIDATCTVKFIAVMDDTGDWGPVGVVSFRRIAAENPAVPVVQPSVPDGTRFVNSQPLTVSFEVPDGYTLYYNTYGNDPIKYPWSRTTYSSPLTISYTKTLTYVVVDDVTGDWSPVQTATYKSRSPDGGYYSSYVSLGNLYVPLYYHIYNGEAYLGRISPTNTSVGISSDGLAVSSTTVLSGSVVLPEELGGCPLVGISANAFCYCSGLTSVTIPDSVTSIGSCAFVGCSGLTSVKTGKGLAEIGDFAFSECSILSSIVMEGNGPTLGTYVIYKGSPTCVVYVHKGSTGWNVAIPGTWNGVQIKYIEDAVFSEPIGDLPWNYQLVAGGVRLVPAGDLGVTELAEGHVDIPSALNGSPVTKIGKDAFKGAEKVTSVTIPASVEAIEASAFRECTRLESVELPEGLQEIGDSAFRECASLTSVTIPASVTNIGYFAFRDCLRLEEVTLAGDAPRRDLGAYMGVPAFTVISGRLGSATAIIYASVTNSTDEITVPESWLEEIAVKFATPAGSESYRAAFEAKFGGDFVEAIKKPTGKTDLRGNPLCVWQDFVAGTDPLNEEDKFTATITIEDGLPVVKWTPKLPDGAEQLRKYTTLGATALGGEWRDISELSAEQRRDQGYQFFQVTVEMR